MTDSISTNGLKTTLTGVMNVYLSTMQKLVGNAISLESTMRNADLDPNVYSVAIGGFGTAISALQDLLQTEVDNLTTLIAGLDPFLYPTVKFYGDYVALQAKNSDSKLHALSNFDSVTVSTVSKPFKFIKDILAGAPTAVTIQVNGWSGEGFADGDYVISAATDTSLTLPSPPSGGKTSASGLTIEVIDIT
jgi:hypothetical protein